MEYEVKHKISGDWTGKVTNAGFRAKKESHQIDHYYTNNEQRDDGRHYFRVREDILNKQSSLDYHVVISDLATKETEITVDDAEGAKIILGYLGLKPICTVDKRRKSFSNGTVTLTLDTVKNLGEFIELEVMGDDETSAKIVIEETERLLGLNKDSRVMKRGYSDLILENLRERKK
jgi:adenylate cyclase, class 2